MADDVTLPGTGEVIASDDVGGRQYQWIKLVYGADGTATAVTSTVGLPIVDAGTRSAEVGDNITALDGPITGWLERTLDFTATATGTAIWTPASGKIFVCRQVFIEWSGSDDGNVFVWSPAASAADTAYTAGTDLLLAQAHPTPSTKGSGGLVRNGLWRGVTSVYPIRVTTTNNLDCTVSVGGYEITTP